MSAYAVIPTACPKCEAKIACHVPVEMGFSVRQPDYDVECPVCKKTVPLYLPGPPIRCVVRRI